MPIYGNRARGPFGYWMGLLSRAYYYFPYYPFPSVVYLIELGRSNRETLVINSGTKGFVYLGL